ncbi:hypothetical protein C2S52_004933, partial [Perilla frutescens var. hirtella]
MCISEGVSDQQLQELRGLMDSPIVMSGSGLSSNEENERVKFLCSFSGSILPRPQDGKLRYVGGETRIVSVRRDISYEELIRKMRELYEGVTVVKYQQPDEDLDALVSVVNDDDVTNMMEEYDKLGTGDGFTRLRIFLFSHHDQDGSLHLGDGDERDNERRYVDALNSLNESPDDVHAQRNMELPMAQMNLRHLTIPHGQLQQAINQRYNEMEAPWSPAYYSPRQPVDQRPVAEFPTSPSSSRNRTPYGENFDRLPEDYNRPPMSTHSIYEQQPQYTDNVLLFPAASVVNENTGFIGNMLQGSNAYDGNSICEQCRIPYQRNQVSSWKPDEQPPNMGNGYLQVPHSCAECPPNREIYMLNSDGNLNPPYYCREPNDPRPMYSETHGHERGWLSPHQSSPWAEEPRPHLSVSVSGRLADSYMVENGMNIPLGHGNVCDGHHVKSQYFHHEDQRYARPGADYGSQVFQDQAAPTGSPVHLPSADERGVCFGNPPYTYGTDNAYQVPHGHIPTQPLWRNVHSPLPGGPSYETSASSQLVNGSVPMNFIRGALEGSPKVRTGLENQNPWAESSQKVVGYDGSLMPDFSHIQAVKFSPSTYTLENHHPCNVDPSQSAALLTKPVTSKDSFTKSDPALPFDDASVTVNVVTSGIDSLSDSETHKSAIMNENGTYEGNKEKNNGGMAKDDGVCESIDKRSDALASPAIIRPVVPKIAVEHCVAVNGDETNAGAPEQQDDTLEFLPELIASVKEATLQSLKEVKAKVREGSDLGSERDTNMKEDAQNHKDGVIELTKAEAEALDRGLQ